MLSKRIIALIVGLSFVTNYCCAQLISEADNSDDATSQSDEKNDSDYWAWGSSEEEVDECGNGKFWHIRGHICVPFICPGGNFKRNFDTGECLYKNEQEAEIAKIKEAAEADQEAILRKMMLSNEKQNSIWSEKGDVFKMSGKSGSFSGKWIGRFGPGEKAKIKAFRREFLENKLRKRKMAQNDVILH